jgi:hypothetical protein
VYKGLFDLQIHNLILTKISEIGYKYHQIDEELELMMNGRCKTPYTILSYFLYLVGFELPDYAYPIPFSLNNELNNIKLQKIVEKHQT